jgi:putative transposase
MHLVLRSTRATGPQSLRRPQHAASIRRILRKFASRYEVKVLQQANAGNHLHLHVKLGHRAGYKPFIRAITAAIAMAVAGTSRWNPAKEKFWDRRPYTRLVIGLAAMQRVDHYILVNQYEGLGYSRAEAHLAVASDIDLGRILKESG